MERLHGIVHGDVQGVGFRFFLIREAHALGLRGWVRNRGDGTVEFVAEGPRADLNRLLEAARRGPGQATVTEVRTDWAPAAGDLDAFDLSW